MDHKNYISENDFENYLINMIVTSVTYLNLIDETIINSNGDIKEDDECDLETSQTFKDVISNNIEEYEVEIKSSLI